MTPGVTPGSLLVAPGGVQPEVSRHELWDLAVRHRIQGSVVLEPQGSFQGSPISSACTRAAFSCLVHQQVLLDSAVTIRAICMFL